MERRISMILAELRDGLGRVQEKDDQFVEEIKQLENLVDYFGDRRFYPVSYTHLTLPTTPYV